MSEDIQKAIEVLKKGGIVIFPTDTTFVIGCRMDNPQIVKRLFEIRRRPMSQPVSVLIDSVEMAQKYIKKIPEDVRKLMKKYWPGGLTIVLSCNKEKVPPLVRSNGDTLGVRMPDHPAILKLIKDVGVPLLGPSANFHKDQTPYRFEDLSPNLIKLVDYVLPGTTSSIEKPSTVIDCSKKPWKILREGAVKLDL